MFKEWVDGINSHDTINFQGNVNESYDLLNEAVFSLQNIDKVVRLYGKLFSKNYSSKFKVIGEESFRKQGGKGFGIRLINDQGYQLRFNWDKTDVKELEKLDRLNKGKKFYISSIDYWDSINTNFEYPTTTVQFFNITNVVQIWDGISKLIKKGVKGKYTLADVSKMVDIDEASVNDINSEERKKFLKNVGANAAVVYRTNKAQLQQMLDDDDDLKQRFDEFVLEIKAGKPEVNTIGKELREAEKSLNEKIYADPEYVFEDIEKLTEFVSKGNSKSLIICGAAGVGKTYHVTSKLEKLFGEAGTKWRYHSGMKTTPFQFYKTVFTERFSTIVFDEADDILKNPDIIVMLKPLLDTSGQNTMEYSNGTVQTLGKSKSEIEQLSAEIDKEIESGKIPYLGKKNTDTNVLIPDKFYFEGQIVFISNMSASKIDSAVMSRSLYIDVHLAASDKIKRIKSILNAKYADMGEDEINSIMESLGASIKAPADNIEYMTPEYMRSIKPVTIRSMEIAIKLKKCGIANWERLAALYA